jgi:signal peptidase I
MSNTPNNPLNPLPPDKGPWLYSGSPQPTPSFQSVQPARAAPGPPATQPGAAAPQPVPPVAISGAADGGPPDSRNGHSSDDASLASIIDTIEAIIIALILALTFRAFIIEAFVIPTGSMAPTLQGAHFNVICPKCGYVFTRDARLDQQVETDANGRKVLVSKDEAHQELLYNTNIPANNRTDPIFCPNCQYPIDPNTLPQHLPPVEVENQGSPRPLKMAWANNGDRILVLKYLYSILEPTRFDVIVFKEPQHAQDNYIKRLIGLPRETIEIIEGDIYVGPPGKSDPKDMTIARKPVRVQKAVWQLVYDNDCYPTDEGEVRKLPGPQYAGWSNPFPVWTNPWRGEGPTADSWDNPDARTADGKPVTVKTVGGPVIYYADDASGRLRFHVRDPYTFNVLGYNDDIHEMLGGSRGPSLPPTRTNDFRLETTWTPAKQAGAGVSLVVGAPRNQVKASWSSSGLLLQRFDFAKGVFETVLSRSAAQCPPPIAGHAHDVALENVDHAARFFIDGTMVAEYLPAWSAMDALAEEKQAKNPALADSFMPQFYIDVDGACSLGHLKLSRDLFYTQDGPNIQYRSDPNAPPGTATMDNPLTLGPDEFFAMGDNSRESSDGRLWTGVFPALDDLGTRPGIVPRRYLLGKAVFVYWPAGFRFMDSIHIPLVPNIGEMRFIRCARQSPQAVAASHPKPPQASSQTGFSEFPFLTL